jgi:hypothetical protein
VLRSGRDDFAGCAAGNDRGVRRPDTPDLNKFRA